MSLVSENTLARIERLKERGCEVFGPTAVAESTIEGGGAAFVCLIRTSGGDVVEEERLTAESAAHDAAEGAERLLDPVEEASIESFPASDPPSF